MNIIVRLVKEEDFKSIYLLNKNGLGYDFDEEKTHQRLKLILENTHNKIFVAEQEENIVGYIHVAEYDCTYSDSLKNILALVVDEEQRGQGIGRDLLQMAESWARETGAVGVRLVSGFERENAHQFYLSCGYFVRKNQKNFIKFFSE